MSDMNKAGKLVAALPAVYSKPFRLWREGPAGTNMREKREG